MHEVETQIFQQLSRSKNSHNEWRTDFVEKLSYYFLVHGLLAGVSQCRSQMCRWKNSIENPSETYKIAVHLRPQKA